ncbi:hypothetical protein PIROE2DRAFT_12509 [Piromyces sp. E2]|nr:hypothetical protein PIROE2DRAFT_12509 [Piromyces sp. E2]|eukprot:OUM61458.1 hypothetical protein PIROE2DRAFT_12509 [Piromyces sp. E2]
MIRNVNSEKSGNISGNNSSEIGLNNSSNEISNNSDNLVLTDQKENVPKYTILAKTAAFFQYNNPYCF